MHVCCQGDCLGSTLAATGCRIAYMMDESMAKKHMNLIGNLHLCGHYSVYTQEWPDTMFHLNDLQGEVKRSGPRIRRDIHINMLFCFKYVKYNGGGGGYC